jgi:beta-lactamase superfamily II metal-dependent hydrolase
VPAKARRKGAPKPARVRVRMYQAGFGDNFLLSFEYDRALPDGRSDRHVLIDFGSSSAPKDRTTPAQIADLINQHTGGQIDVVVVTHRHRDHLSAFGSADVVNRLMAADYPKLVVRSWTEDPQAAPDANGVAAAAPIHGDGAAVAGQSRQSLAALRSAQNFAETLAGMVAAAHPGSLGAELCHLAGDQLANHAAVEQLERWAGADRGEYLHYGMPTRIEDLIPGIGVSVMGPPTVDQHPAVAGQSESDPSEFWMIYKGLLKDIGPGGLLNLAPDDPSDDDAPISPTTIGPVGPVRWLTDRMQRQQLNSLLRIVRVLDGVLNNTSVVLLFEVPTTGGQPLRLLFGGDAQIENWEYALKFAPDKDTNLDRLRLVDLYKVGHHGSRNATPRTLFNLWTEPATNDRPMIALMSTKSGVHGKSPATAVPRKTLTAALDTRMTLYSTQDFPAKKCFVELMADLKTGSGFTEVEPA